MSKNLAITFGLSALALIAVAIFVSAPFASSSKNADKAGNHSASCPCCSEKAKAASSCCGEKACSKDKACCSKDKACCCGNKCECCDACKNGGECTCEDCKCCGCCKDKACCCGDKCECCDACKNGGECTCEDCKCCGCCKK